MIEKDGTSSEWTVKTLKDFIDQRLTDRDSASQLAFDGINKRLDVMNEFRQVSSDQRFEDQKARMRIEESFLTKEIYGLEHRNLENLVQKNYDNLIILIQKNNERIVEMDKKLFALSELKVDKREGLSSRYMNSAIIFAALSFVGTIITVLWNLFNRLK